MTRRTELAFEEAVTFEHWPLSFELSALSFFSASRRRFLWIVAVSVIGLGLNLIGCAAPTPPEPVGEKDIPPAYTAETQLMKPEECGRCHSHFYYLIKTEGGKHRIDCKRCHVQFHVYRPGKVQYEDVLPKCEACHEQVHGEDLALCSACHTNAHTPMKIPAERPLEEGCFICHAEVDKEMKTYITKHTGLYCSSCHHTRHRYVPECMECHRPHAEGMTQAECLACHPPHKVREVVYPEDIPDKTCAGCHRDAYEKLKQTGAKHSALGCAKCHPEKHGAIMRCRECHDEPHGASMMEKFRVCGKCHGTAHSLSLE